MTKVTDLPTASPLTASDVLYVVDPEAAIGARSKQSTLSAVVSFLIANLTTFTSVLSGLVPASGGGSTNFLRADGAWAVPPGVAGSDGDKGDITVSGGGAGLTIDPDAVTYAKLQNISATSRVLGRKTAGAGDAEECTLSEILDFIGSAAQGDILYRGASAWARHPAGAKGLSLLTQGAGANPIWGPGCTLIASGAISAGATLDISLAGTDFDEVEIDYIDLAPATDAVAPWLRFSQSGSFLSGASDYTWASLRSNTATLNSSSAADSKIIITSGTAGNLAGEVGNFKVNIYKPAASGLYKTVLISGFFIQDNPLVTQVRGGGRLLANTNAIDGIRLLFSSGNLAASGVYVARGWKYS